MTPGTGRVRWSATTDPETGFTALPVAVPGGFVLTTPDCTVRVDADGHQTWTLPGTLVTAATLGDRIVVASLVGTSMQVSAVEAAGGRELWRKDLAGGWSAMAGGHGAVMLVGAGADGAGAETTVVVVDPATGTILRRGNFGAGQFNSVIADGDLLVGAGATDDGAGGVVATDRDGHEVLSAKVDLPSPAAVAVTPELVVVRSAGEMIDTEEDLERAFPTRLIALDRADGRVRWERTLAPSRRDAAAVPGGLVLLQAEDEVVAVDASSGSTLWSRPAAAAREARLVPLDAASFALGERSGAVAVVGSRTGATAWEHALDGPVDAIGLLDGGRVLLVATLAGTATAHERATGAVVWTAQVGPRVGEPVAAVVPSGDLVAVVRGAASVAVLGTS